MENGFGRRLPATDQVPLDQFVLAPKNRENGGTARLYPKGLGAARVALVDAVWVPNAP